MERPSQWELTGNRKNSFDSPDWESNPGPLATCRLIHLGHHYKEENMLIIIKNQEMTQ